MATTSNSSGSPTLTRYKALSFDVFGTLLDWEGGFYPYLLPLLNQLAPNSPLRGPFPNPPGPGSRLAPKHPAIRTFDRHEGRFLAEMPKGRFETLMEYAYQDTATELGLSASREDAFAAAHSCGKWPAFPDTVEALKRLGKHYKLVALSNVSEAGIREVLLGPLKDVKFDAVYTAEKIGSYKPAMENFEYLLEGVKRDLGVEREELLHVAHGVASDQLTAEALDIDHVWVERGVDNWLTVPKDNMKRLRVVSDVKQLADEVEKDFHGRSKGI